MACSSGRDGDCPANERPTNSEAAHVATAVGCPGSTANPRKFEHEFRRINARIPYTLPEGHEENTVPTVWLPGLTFIWLSLRFQDMTFKSTLQGLGFQAPGFQRGRSRMHSLTTLPHPGSLIRLTAQVV